MKRFALLTMCLLAACGDDAPTPSPPPGTKPDEAPDVTPFDWQVAPDDALDALRDLEDATARNRLLAAWPLDGDYAEAPATQRALTWRLQRHLANDRVTEAAQDLSDLALRFERGKTPEGRTLSLGVMREAVAEKAVEVARRQAEGDRPDRQGATKTLALATRLASDDLRDALTSARRWIETDTVDGLTTVEPFRGTQVLAIMDHFTLGDAQIQATLRRWSRDETMRVSIVPILRGEVREGIRRVPVDPDVEIEALRENAKTLGAHFDANAIGRDMPQQLGLPDNFAAVLAIDRHGRIVGRLSARTPSLQKLENTIQRLRTR